MHAPPENLPCGFHFASDIRTASHPTKVHIARCNLSFSLNIFFDNKSSA